MLKQNLNQLNVFIILAACFGFIGSCVLLNISLVYGFGASIIVSSLIFIKIGFSFCELLNMVKKGLSECKILYILILLIGATVSIWLCSGVVPTMIYYGFEYMKGMNFLFAAFLIISVSSIFMGTAVGTISTIGIAILGIGKGFGIPSNILLGVIVSGAFIADKISPISGILNLTLSSTKTNYKPALKSMLVTLVPTFILSSMIYYILGMNYSMENHTSNIIEFQSAIKHGFYISPWLLLVPVLILTMSFLGIKIVYSILTGLFGGIIISFLVEKMSINEILNSIFWGYRGHTSSAKLNEILISGGMISMIEVLLIVIGAIAISSILEGTGLIKYVTDKVISKISSKGELILKTGLISGVLTIVTCDQTMGIVLPGRLLNDKYKELKVSENILARTISDTGTIIAPLMPWNVNSLIIGLISSISAAKYASFAVLCYISPLITFLYCYIQGKLPQNAKFIEQ